MPVTVEEWLASPASEGWRLLWLTLENGESGVLVPVESVKQSAALNVLSEKFEGVAWVDRKSRFDELFSRYRNVLTGLLFVALAVIACGAIARLGWRKGIISLVPSVLSLSCGLAVLALSGHPVNLFSLLALVLVLGIGINYTLFFSNPRGTPLTSMLAITLAMITTLLTLGMLVFSATQAISSFGIVLVSGIFTAFLLSPLAMPTKKRKKENDDNECFWRMATPPYRALRAVPLRADPHWLQPLAEAAGTPSTGMVGTGNPRHAACAGDLSGGQLSAVTYWPF